MHPKRLGWLDLMFVAMCAVFVLVSALGSPYPFQSDHRVFPLFLFADGKPVYGDPATGAIAPSLYPPLSFLAYFPALLFRRPGAAITCGKLMAQVYTIVPILWLLWSRRNRPGSGRQPTVMLMLAALMVALTSDILSKMVMLHADAPALFLCFCACLLMERFLRNSGSGTLFAMALCCAAAPWAKQPAVAIVLMPAITLLALRRWKALAGFSLVYILFQTLLAGLFFFLFRGQRLFFWVFAAVFKQEMGSVGAGATHGVSGGGALTQMLLVIVFYAVFTRFRLLVHGAEARQVRLEDIFVLAAVVELPSSILGFLFPGADSNALLYFAQPAFIFVLLRLQADVLPRIAIPMLRRALAAVTVVCVLWSTTPFENATSGWSLRYGFDVDLAYKYMRAHPGQVWFPRYPLTSYLAEGKIYHSEMGFLNLEAMGIPISESHLLAYIPNGGRLIACAADCFNLNIPWEEYQKISLADLRGHWQVFERTGGGVMDAEPLNTGP